VRQKPNFCSLLLNSDDCSVLGWCSSLSYIYLVRLRKLQSNLVDVNVKQDLFNKKQFIIIIERRTVIAEIFRQTTAKKRRKNYAILIKILWWDD